MNTSSASLSASESTGFFGAYGGQFVPDDLKARLDEVTEAFDRYSDNSFFKDELDYYFKHYTGRPNPIFFCANLSERLGGAKIYLKREDLNHLGAHKINNTLGQCLLAKRMGKKRIVAETGAGQHGVATAATAALLGLECTVYMGAEDMKRQRLNVIRMEMLGAKVVPALSGQRTLKEAVDAFFLLSRTEGIIPALESSHALAQAVKVAPTLPKDAALLVCLSGRGDKDVEQMEAFLESAK